jgi:hypothetical protein
MKAFLLHSVKMTFGRGFAIDHEFVITRYHIFRIRRAIHTALLLLRTRRSPVTRPGFIRTISLTALVVLITFTTLVATPVWSQEVPAPASEGGNASSAGMQVLAGLTTILYLPVKGAFAIAGGIVGGLTYVFTGFDDTSAKKVWTTSMYGTYLVTPEHLQGDKAIRFLGVPDAETPVQSSAPATEAVPLK